MKFFKIIPIGILHANSKHMTVYRCADIISLIAKRISMCTLFKDFLDFCVFEYGISWEQCFAKKMVGHISIRALSLSTILTNSLGLIAVRLRT